MPRLFTGLEIPAEIGQTLSSLRGGLPGARWIDPENYHVTLRFIGDIDGHLLKQSTAGDIVRNTPAMTGARENDVPEISHDTNINELFKYFSKHDELIVVENNQQKSLNRQELFKYLSNDEGGDQ